MADDARGLRAPLALLSTTRLVVNTAHRMLSPFLPAIGRGLGISLTEAGLLVSLRNVAGMATPLTTAAVGSGERRRRAIQAGLAMFAAGAVITAATGVVAGAVVGFLLLGLAQPMFVANAQAYIADRAPGRRRARALAVFEMTWALALLVGAPAAGWLIDGFGWEAPFWVIGGLVLVSLLATRRVLEPDVAIPRTDRKRAALRGPAGWLLLVAFLFSMSSELMNIVFGAWLEDQFALSLVALGWAAALVASAELTGESGTFLLAERLGKRRLVAIGLAVSGLAYLGLVASSDTLAIGLVVFGVAVAGFELAVVTTIPLATEVVSTGWAAYLSILVMAMSAARAIGSAVGPALFEATGLHGNALASAGLTVAALAVLLTRVPDA